MIRLAMNFNPNCDDDCECPSEPKWLTLAIAILPAVLPIVFEKVADAIAWHFEKKSKSTEKEESIDDN
jgi:hypothetical protein